MSDYDLVIRNGTIVDGRGAAPYRGDLAIRGSHIAAVGTFEGSGHQEIDATDRIVTPGFIDVHTHYDGQVTWEHTLGPSSNHGVTTVIGGNCGVGFAPCRPGDQDRLIKVMEGVEDIPEVVMAEGIPWNWESFPEYLDSLSDRAFDIDVGMQVAHSPLRVYVMGDRGINHEASTESDRQRMADLVTEAVRAGAIGVSTSRSLGHRAKDGHPAPSVLTADEELFALARGLGAAKGGVFQIIVDVHREPEGEMRVMEEIARQSARPISFSLAEIVERPAAWRAMIAGLDRAQAAGLPIRGQVFPRPIGVMMGLELSLSPIVNRPGYIAIKHLPLAERVAILRNPEVKARILAEEPIPDPTPITNALIGAVDKCFALGEQPDYMPDIAMRLDKRAEQAGVTPLSLAYDLMLEQDGHAILYYPSANFTTGTAEPIREMMLHEHTILGLGDGGAHYGMICDAGFPTYVLTHWARDVEEGQRMPIEWIVQELSRRPAETVGLTDRGVLAPGYKADINVIDHSNLMLHSPRVAHDLPAGGRRLHQRAEGYDATIVSGVVTYRHGVPTGQLPGRLVRGDGYAPLERVA
ncbi:amidohydrolase family protein [Sphingobium sp. EM0848]|uniref:N-acyl-D-amino-acid deacylase family protein n=1 Tax=Sphingobium sp. EM0848 TaxID=2743473 RepID=UPI00159C38C1|nr:amidohydrolase family protein [Sphingobium sp. EM0848]